MRTLFAFIILGLSFNVNADYHIKQNQSKKAMICNSEDAIKRVHKAHIKARPDVLVKLIDSHDCIEVADDFQFTVGMTSNNLYSYAVPNDPRLPEDLTSFWILACQIEDLGEDNEVADTSNRNRHVV
jgi:hypothetical protein